MLTFSCFLIRIHIQHNLRIFFENHQFSKKQVIFDQKNKLRPPEGIFFRREGEIHDHL